MAQELSLRDVPMYEMDFRKGANLDLMATTILTTFRNHRLELYEHRQLINDLNKLKIVERRNFGFKLESVSDKTGHADLGISLAICLPLMVEQAGTVPVVAGAITDSFDNRSPFSMAVERFKFDQKAYAEEQEEAWEAFYR